MALDETGKEAIKEWIDNSILDSNYCRWRARPDESQFFPVAGIQVPFAEGIAVLKYATTGGYTFDVNAMCRDIRSVRKAGQVSKSEYTAWQQRAKPSYAQKPLLYLCAAIIEMESGCYSLTPDEFKALKDLQLRGTYNGVPDAQEIAKTRPRALANAEYGEYLALVNEVLRERKLPEIDIQARLNGAEKTPPAATPAPASQAMGEKSVEGTLQLPSIQQIQAELLAARRQEAELAKQVSAARAELQRLTVAATQASLKVSQLESSLRYAPQSGRGAA